MAVTDASDALISLVPTKELDAKKTFGIDLDWKVPAFAEKSSYVPDLDPAYRFDPQTTRAILAGFGVAKDAIYAHERDVGAARLSRLEFNVKLPRSAPARIAPS